MRRRAGWCTVAVAVLMLVGCSKKVLVPPMIDLGQFEMIGMVQFSSNAEGSLNELASQEFLETIQASQPGVGILELGTEADVLGSVGSYKLDPGAIRAIGAKYGVDAVLTGHVEVTDVKPSVEVFSLPSIGVEANVDALLKAKLFKVANGATIWTNSARGTENVGHVGMSRSGSIHFGADDPKNAYGRLVQVLVYNVTSDFRSHYVKQ